MQQETTIVQTTSQLPSKMESKEGLRRAYSEISNKLEKLVIISTGNNPCPDAASTFVTAAGEQAVEAVRCACCGVSEDCTAAYIVAVRAAFCGDWLCGLCAEAVKELVARQEEDPPAGGGGGGVAAALRRHEAECRDFNATTRLNPALSLAGSMRRIARRSLDRRTASCQERLLGGEPAAAAATALARSVSCDPWFMADVMKGSAGDRCR
ncbi:hypothetical protein ACP4OV_031498 [Aristida adscensionis]